MKNKNEDWTLRGRIIIYDMMINQYVGVGLHLPAAISDILHVVCGVSSIILIWAGILHIAIFMMYQEKEGVRWIWIEQYW